MAFKLVESHLLMFKKMNIDFLSCGSHKWMMGVEGCGFCVHRRKTLQIHVPTNSWLAEP